MVSLAFFLVAVGLICVAVLLSSLGANGEDDPDQGGSVSPPVRDPHASRDAAPKAGTAADYSERLKGWAPDDTTFI